MRINTFILFGHYSFKCLMYIILFSGTVHNTVLAQNTILTIKNDAFLINGKLTYEGRYWQDNKIEGLLFNSRMVQGIFDDSNPESIYNWYYPDAKKWDPDRNTREFVQNMKLWRDYGLLAFTINIQGGSPFGYSRITEQIWNNSGYTEDGSLNPDYMKRLKKILDRADELGMIPIIGLFYFGQDQRLRDEKAVINATNNVINWLHLHTYKNVLIEINNECNVRYDHEILQPHRVHELIELVKKNKKCGFRYYVSTSYGGNTIPCSNVVKSSDFILLHGNGVNNPERIAEMVELTRKVKGYRPMPILFNEDDHFDFNKPLNNMIAATRVYASWGYFDYRMKGEGFEQGYQSVPVDWGINSERKKGFFFKVKEITSGQ